MEIAWVGSVKESSEELQLERLSISGSRTGDVIWLVWGVLMVPLLRKKEVALLSRLIKFRPLMLRVTPNLLLGDSAPSPTPDKRGF